VTNVNGTNNSRTNNAGDGAGTLFDFGYSDDAATASSRFQKPGTVEGNRRRARVRRNLLVISSPFLAVMLVAAGWLTSLSGTASKGLTEFDRGLNVVASQTFGGLLDHNYVEKWIPYFDRGNALAADADYIPAIDDFEDALQLAPESRRCEVIVNLALGWERLADGYAQSGLYAGAVQLYQTSLDVLENEGCTPPEEPVQGRDPGEELDIAEGRVKAKLDASTFLGEQGETGEPSTPEERQQELEEQGDEAAEQNAEDEARERAEENPGGYTDKPW
jgi:tetratricopeptide (TPR) repeat protein